METPLIDPQEVEDALRDCLYDEYEMQAAEHRPPEDAVIVEGVVNKFGFHPERLESYRDQVREWLNALDDKFRADGGGGWSFMRMPFDEKERQWGEQRTADFLLCMAIGLDLAKFAAPREVWQSLPGSVPYIVTFPQENTEPDPAA